MFIAYLFIVTKTWKQPKQSSVGEYINKMCYIQRWNIIQCSKGMQNQAMKRQRGILNVHY